MFGARSAQFVPRVIKIEKNEKPLPKEESTQPGSDKKPTTELSDSDKGLVTNFTWDYNPKEFFFPKKLSDDDNPDAPITWNNPEDPNVKVILIRHSQTLFNIDHDTLMKALMSKQMNKIKWIWKFTQQKKQNKPGYINGPLTDFGRELATKNGVELRQKFPHIKRIVISPMRRCMQTLECVMAGDPRWENNEIPVDTMEELRETLISSCDIGCWTKDELEGVKYPERYDLSFMNKYKDPHFWFLETMDVNMKARAAKAMKGHVSIEEKRKALYDSIGEIKYLPYEWETIQSNYERIHITAKRKLRELCIKHNLKDHELLVVGHGITFCFFWGDGWNGWTKKPKKFRVMKNAEFLEYPLYWAPEDAPQIAYNAPEKKVSEEMTLEVPENRYQEQEDGFGIDDTKSRKGIYENAEERLSDFQSTGPSPVKMRPEGQGEGEDMDKDGGDKVGRDGVEKPEFGEMIDEGKEGRGMKNGLEK